MVAAAAKEDAIAPAFPEWATEGCGRAWSSTSLSLSAG